MRINELVASLQPWKRAVAIPIRDATYSAAVGMSDEEIQAVVEATLVQARKDLSS